MSSKARHGKPAVTHWTVRQSYQADRLSLVELALETGRTHQIRVHLAEMNRPLVADPLYGQRARINKLADAQLRQLLVQFPGQALHAQVLGFLHPVNGEFMEFVSELPAPFAAVIDYLNKKYAVSPS